VRKKEEGGGVGLEEGRRRAEGGRRDSVWSFSFKTSPFLGERLRQKF